MFIILMMILCCVYFIWDK